MSLIRCAKQDSASSLFVSCSVFSQVPANSLQRRFYSLCLPCCRTNPCLKYLTLISLTRIRFRGARLERKTNAEAGLRARSYHLFPLRDISKADKSQISTSGLQDQKPSIGCGRQEVRCDWHIRQNLGVLLGCTLFSGFVVFLLAVRLLICDAVYGHHRCTGLRGALLDALLLLAAI